MPTVKDVISAMERIAPPALAVSGDPIGLHSGKRSSKVTKIAVSMDASLKAIEAAARKKAEMLVVHHPRFYKGLSTLADHDPSGRRACAIIHSGLAVYSAHTNLDIAPGGVNDVLAGLVGIREPRALKVEYRERLLKLAVFVPATHIDKVRAAVCDQGAGAIGEYSDCTFRVRGTGTFRGGKDTKPFLGKPGILEEADEFRLETVFGEFSADRILAAMLRAHPYEEVAYDLYPLTGWADVFGIGRVGSLQKAETLSALARRIAKATGSTMTQFTGKATAKVKKIATWGGSGVDLKGVLASGVDCLIAGEVGYHDLEAFIDSGVGVITLGHGYSEKPVLKPLAAKLRLLLPGVKVELVDSSEFYSHNV